MRLVIVRHGEPHHSQCGVIGGMKGCTGLTERGARQSQALARRLGTTGELGKCAALLHGPWPRARQTATILRSALPGAVVEEDENLCELMPGAADGLTWEERRRARGAFDLEAEPDRLFSPGGESWNAFTTRVGATLQRLADRFDGRMVVAVSHAGFVVVSILLLFDAMPRRPAARVWLDLAPRPLQRRLPSPGHGCKVTSLPDFPWRPTPLPRGLAHRLQQAISAPLACYVERFDMP